MKVAFSGSRYRSERNKIRNILTHYNPKKDIIVHGGCPRGIDKEVDEIARKMGFKVIVFYPEKPEARYFLNRNIKIAKFSDILYAFPKIETLELINNKGLSIEILKGIRGGTEHTIRQFLKLRKPVVVL